MKTFSRLPPLPRPHGGASQIVMVILCVIALAVIGWLLSLPPELQAKYVPPMAGLGIVWMVLAALVVMGMIAVLGFLMPYFVWQCAREARRSRELLEDIRALQRELVEQGKERVPYGVTSPDEVPIYPPKAARMPQRETLRR